MSPLIWACRLYHAFYLLFTTPSTEISGDPDLICRPRIPKCSQPLLSASEFENCCIADFSTYLIDINKPTLPTNFLIWSCLHTKELLLVASVAYALFCEDTYGSSIAATRAILLLVSYCTSSALLSSAFRYRFMYLLFSSHLLMLSRCIEHLLSPLGACPHSFQTSC